MQDFIFCTVINKCFQDNLFTSQCNIINWSFIVIYMYTYSLRFDKRYSIVQPSHVYLGGSTGNYRSLPWMETNKLDIPKRCSGVNNVRGRRILRGQVRPTRDFIMPGHAVTFNYCLLPAERARIINGRLRRRLRAFVCCIGEMRLFIERQKRTSLRAAIRYM